jgi:hypothetical protein
MMAGNSEKIQQDAYALVNLMARYEFTENLLAQVNADNVTDEKYFDIFDAYGALTYGAPRSITASAKYRFQDLPRKKAQRRPGAGVVLFEDRQPERLIASFRMNKRAVSHELPLGCHRRACQ